MKNIVFIFLLLVSWSAFASDTLSVRKEVYVKGKAFPYMVEYRYIKPKKCNILIWEPYIRGNYSIIGRKTGSLEDKPEDILKQFIQ
jgi:hypothetical protein